MICRKCGRKNLDGSQSCVYCGMSMEPTLPKEPAAPAEPVLDGLSSDASLSAAMIAEIKAESVAKAGNARTAVASASFPPPSPPPSTQRSAQPSPPPAARPSPRPSAQPAYSPPAAQPSSRLSPPPSPLQLPRTKDDSADETFELPEISEKTKRNVIIAAACFFGFLILSSMLGQCSKPMTDFFADDASSGNKTITVKGTTSSGSSFDYSPGSGTNTGSGSGMAPDAPSGTSATADSGNSSIEDYDNPVVILDEEEIKITINVGSGSNNIATGYLDFECVIENKTDKKVSLFFGDIAADGLSGDQYSAHFFRKESYQGSYVGFVQGENEAYLSFDEDSVFGDIANLTGTIIVFESDTGEEIKQYAISIARL